MVFSTTIPTIAAQENEASKLSQKELKKANVAAAEKAPIIYREPWAKFIRPITPKISVNPADNKNSMKPNCNPFRNCSINNSAVIFIEIQNTISC